MIKGYLGSMSENELFNTREDALNAYKAKVIGEHREDLVKLERLR